MSGRTQSPIERVCLAKKPYPSLEAAEHASRLVNKHQGARTRAFKCPVGEHWHVGHSDRRRKKRG
jgi:hypothetical protein